MQPNFVLRLENKYSDSKKNYIGFQQKYIFFETLIVAEKVKKCPSVAFFGYIFLGPKNPQFMLWLCGPKACSKDTGLYLRPE